MLINDELWSWNKTVILEKVACIDLELVFRTSRDNRLFKLLLLDFFKRNKFISLDKKSVCDPNPCQNKGRCLHDATDDEGKVYQCACEEGFSGDHCQGGFICLSI